MIDCALFHGFPYTDLPFAGVTVVATSNDDPALARQAAEDTARRIWEVRAPFTSELPDAAQAVAQALASNARPVVIAESSDNPGGGAPGDGTHLLRAMVEAGLSEATFGYIYDPETAAQAHTAGTGATIDARIGGKTDDLHGTPVEARAYVKCLTDGQFRLTGALGTGAPMDLGKTARLVVRGIDVIVGSDRTQTLDESLFILHGIDVRRYTIVALKSSMHFRAGFEPLAAEIIRADTPGATTTKLENIPYTRLRPVWPLDAEVTYP
jgi:microcystin degradation protein MlrC